MILEFIFEGVKWISVKSPLMEPLVLIPRFLISNVIADRAAEFCAFKVPEQYVRMINVKTKNFFIISKNNIIFPIC